MTAPACPFDRILVPARPAPDAERALSVAVGLALRTGVPLRLLSVAWPIDARITRGFAAGPDEGVPPVEIERRVVGVGSVADAVVAEAEPGTLICMASHGAYGPARTLARTVAEEVIRTAREPVLLVGPHAVPENSLGAGRRVVACLDGSPGDDGTVTTARRWSRAFGLPLCLVHVAAAPDPALERRLHDIARSLGGEDGYRVLHDRHPARALADLAATAAVAVFVMAPAGRAGWGRVLAGSVTASTVRRATAPVLAVPPRAPG